jgi:RHS repeat-associated protein
MRTSRQSGSTTQRFVVDSVSALPTVLAEVDQAGGLLARHVVQNGRVLESARPSGQEFLVHDGAGSVREMLDAHAVVQDTVTYDSFGVKIAETGSSPNEFRFAGEQLDPESGLVYLRARYYDPMLGRFLAPEPRRDRLLSVDTRDHHYSYAANDPVNRRDPSGQQDVSLEGEEVGVGDLGNTAALASPRFGPTPLLAVKLHESADFYDAGDMAVLEAGAEGAIRVLNKAKDLPAGIYHQAFDPDETSTNYLGTTQSNFQQMFQRMTDKTVEFTNNLSEIAISPTDPIVHKYCFPYTRPAPGDPRAPSDLDVYATTPPAPGNVVVLCSRFFDTSIPKGDFFAPQNNIIHELGHVIGMPGGNEAIGDIGAYNLADKDPALAANSAVNYQLAAWIGQLQLGW